jgi:hypothetical protein
VEFNWGVFWALLAVLAIVVSTLALPALWRAMRAGAAKVGSPGHLINQAFQGKRAFKPAAPLNELSVDELKREYQALRDVEKALSKRLALETRDNPSASREQVIDAAVSAFTAGAFTREEMEAMIREANARSR